MQYIKRFFFVVLSLLIIVPNLVTPIFAETYFITNNREINYYYQASQYYYFSYINNTYPVIIHYKTSSAEGYYLYGYDSNNLDNAYYQLNYKYFNNWRNPIQAADYFSKNNATFSNGSQWISLGYSANTNIYIYDATEGLSNAAAYKEFIDKLKGGFDPYKPASVEQPINSNACVYMYKDKLDQIEYTTSSNEISEKSKDLDIYRSNQKFIGIEFEDREVPKWDGSIFNTIQSVINYIFPRIKSFDYSSSSAADISYSNVQVNSVTSEAPKIYQVYTCYDYDTGNYLPVGSVSSPGNGSTSNITNITYQTVYEDNSTTTIYNQDITNIDNIYNDYSSSNQTFNEVINNYNEVTNNYSNELDQKIKDINFDITLPDTVAPQATFITTMFTGFYEVLEPFHWYINIALILFLIYLILGLGRKK